MKNYISSLLRAKMIIIFLCLFSSQANAQCAYYVQNSNPWGQTSNITAMNLAFGTGNWIQATYSTSAATIFASGNCYVMLEGSNYNAIALQNFLTANQVLIQNWVTAGGRLFINAAPNEGGSMNWYFGGVGLNFSGGSSTGTAVSGSHPIFLGPNLPTITSWTGNSFTHGNVTGTGLTDVILGQGLKAFCYKAWGNGIVYFGAMTQPTYWTPTPQGINIWNNIFAYTAVLPGGALNFDGTNDYVVSANNINITGNQSRTIEYRARLNNAYNHHVNWGGTGFPVPDGSSFGMYMTGGFLHFYNHGATGTFDHNTGFAADGNYHNVAVTYDGTTVRTYVDGNPTPFPSATRNLNTVNGRVYVGIRQDLHLPTITSSTFEEVRVWNRALCQGEIQAHMNCQLTGSETGLRLYYRFNHGLVGSSNVAVTTTTDHSPNANTGTLTNFTLTGAASNWVAGLITGTCSAFTPTPPIASSNSPVTAGGTITLTGSGAVTYSWAGPNSFTSTNAIDNITNAQPINAGTYTLTGVAGNGCSATATTTVVVHTPASGLHFDGSNDYVDLQSQPTSLSNADFTLEVWIKNTGIHASIMGVDDGDGAWEAGEKLLHTDGTGRPVFEAFNSGYIIGTQSVNDGNWHHIAVTFSFADQRRHMYVDGADVTTTDGSSWFNGQWGMSGTYKFGRSPAAWAFTGSMDEFRIWNRELCQGEIQAHMNCQLPAGQTGLRAYYQFNQGNVGVANPGINTLTDASGNSFTGTLNNFTLTATTSNWVAGNVTGTCTAFSFTPTITAGGSLNICPGGSVTLTSSVATSYQWKLNGTDIPLATSQTYTANAAGNYTVATVGCTGTSSAATVTVTPAIVINPTQTNETPCITSNNGTATATVTGGTPGFNYNWTPGNPPGDGTATATGLTAGTWTVTVTDANNCTANQSYTITQPTQVTGTFTQTSVSCFGGNNGTATVTPAGGTGPYTYSWSNGQTTATATGLSATTYTVTIFDASLCSGTATVTISQPTVLSASTTQVNVSCNGLANGSATVTPAGGTSPYTYLWSNGQTNATASGLAAGTYSVLVTDANGCTTTPSVTISQPAVLTATTSQVNVTCNGLSNGTATVIPTGGTTAYTYLWSNGQTTPTATGLSAGTYNVMVTDALGCTVPKTVTITQPAVLAATTTQVNVSCNGLADGSATVIPTGGTTSYTYLWNNGQTTATATGLVAGTYTVMVTDALGCTVPKTVIISQPTVLAATTTQTNVYCNGGTNGTATVIPTGGTTPYTYLWSNGQGSATATGLIAGTYTVLVTDAHNCTTTQSVTITQPTVLTATTTQGNVNCFGGNNASATVTPTGGTTPYTYLWSNGQTTAAATGLVAGVYTVMVTDALGCGVNKVVTITQPTVLAISSASSTNLTCAGSGNGTATVTATGGTAPYAYQWSSGQTTATITGLAAGTYNVVVTDNHGCTVSQSFIITQPALLVATPGTQTNVSCNGGNNGAANITVTGGTGTYNYNWTPGNPLGDNTNSVSGLTAGTWSVTVTDQNNCTASTTMTITQPPALVVTPLSQTNILCNGGNNGAASVTASGGTGTLTYNWTPGNPAGDGTNSVTGLVAGAYMVTVTDANNCTATQSFTITQPPVLTLSNPLQTNVSCNGGSNGTATITATGGAGTLSYNWTPGNPPGDGTNAVTGLTAGTWTVTVADANGCSATQSYTITQNSALVATAVTQTNVNCFGQNNGSATVGVTGGTGAGTYNYLWAPSGGNNNIASNLAAGTYTVTVTDANLCATTQTFTITQPAVLASTQSHTNATCNGFFNGSVTVTPTGGTLPYTYSWTPAIGNTATVSNLAAGTYNVIVTDGHNCSTAQSIVVTQPTTLVTSAVSQVNVLCAGANTGAATVGVTGGTIPYTYNWLNIGLTTPTVTGLLAGTYAVTVTDGQGCTATQGFVITQPAPMALTGTQVNVACNGGTNGSATVTVTGGVAPYTYSWAPSGGTSSTAHGLSAGTYTVTVTDANGCTATHTFVIVQATTLAVATVSQNNVGCFGGNTGSVTVNASGGTFPYVYSWSPSGGTGASATGLTVGTYTVLVTDANLCSATQSYTITQPTQLTATGTQTNVSCNAGNNGTATVTPTGGTGAYTYSWFPSGGNAATATGLSAGTYVATMMDANNCSVTHTFTITQPTMLTAVSAGQTNVGCSGGNNGTATVAGDGGTGPYTYLWDNGQTTTTATGLTAGTYTATVTDANMCTATQIFTITQPIALAYNATQSNVGCNGGTNGSATITMMGGTSPYTYSWAPSGGTAATASNLAAGTYTVTATDANSCSVTATYTITQPQLLGVTTGSNSPVCTDNSIALTSNITGGTAPFTTAWSGPAGYTSNVGSPTIANATMANGGTYNITITDGNNCSVSATQSVTVNQTPQITIQPTATTACIGSSADFSVTAIGTGITYQWRANGTNITNNIIYSGATTNTLSLSDATGLNGTQYDVVITGICGNVTSASAMLNISTTNTWNGAVSTAWSDGDNWSCGNVPTLDLDVVIPATAPNMPLVDIPSAKARSITIDAGSSLGFTGTANKLEVRANIANQGSFNASNGAIKLSGMGTQSIPGGAYRELEIAGADVKTLQADATVMQSLKLTAGYLRLGDRNLTLAEPSVITGGSAASFVITDSMGALIRVNLGTGANEDAEVFPVGQQAGVYTPATITNAGDMDNFSVRVIDGVYATYNNDEPVGVAHTDNVVNKTWIISEALDGGSNATIALSWPSGEQLPGFSNANCNVSHFDEGTNNWNDGPFSAATSNAGLYTQSVTGIGAFSPFAVGTANIPLVVEETKHLVYGLVVFPNPVVTDMVFVKLGNDALATDMNIMIFDVLGRMVAQQKYKAGTYNRQAIEVNIGDVAAGTYTLRLKQDGAVPQSAKFTRK